MCPDSGVCVGFLLKCCLLALGPKSFQEASWQSFVSLLRTQMQMVWNTATCISVGPSLTVWFPNALTMSSNSRQPLADRSKRISKQGIGVPNSFTSQMTFYRPPKSHFSAVLSTPSPGMLCSPGKMQRGEKQYLGIHIDYNWPSPICPPHAPSWLFFPCVG